jgi:alkylation response protein AidB-like acyl-CoA dehydrogenase
MTSEAHLRREVRALLAESAHRREPHQYFMDRSGPTAELYRELGARGWLAISWPTRVGGGGQPAALEFALWDELAYARAARPSVAAGLIGRSIVDAGTPEQRDWLLPGIAAGQTSFALGYSEPEAGSDLTALRTRAVHDGGTYIVNGEKRWTSDAHNADYLWLLTRTGELAERSRGLTLLVVPTGHDGITLSPIQTLDGHQLNEVRLSDVRVPAGHRIGEEGGAWRIIQTALARERHLQVLPGRVRRDFEDLREWARHSGADADPQVRRQLTRLGGWVEVIAHTASAIVRDVDVGRDTAVPAARQKVLGIGVIQAISRFPLEWGDASQLLVGEPFEFMWRECVLESVAGGTSEVMKSIIARRALGMGG